MAPSVIFEEVFTVPAKLALGGSWTWVHCVKSIISANEDAVVKKVPAKNQLEIQRRIAILEPSAGLLLVP
jgi:hypothetical protein